MGNRCPERPRFKTLKTELVPDADFSTRRRAEHELFRYIEGFYAHQRLHSSLDYRSPGEVEREDQEAA